MPFAHDVLDFLDKLEIVGVPSRVNPGMTVKPKLTPSLDILTAAAEEVLANLKLPLPKLDFTLNFDQFDLTPAPIDPKVPSKAGQVDLQVLFKAVETAKPVDTSKGLNASAIDPNETATSTLPYATPKKWIEPPLTAVPYLEQALGTATQSLLGRVKGKIEPIEKLAGSVMGTLTSPATTILGTLTRAMPGVNLEVTMTWRIQDDNGQDLTADEHFVLLEKTVLSDTRLFDKPKKLLPPVLAFLPEFAEYGGLDVMARRWISCAIKVVQRKPDTKPEDNETEDNETEDATFIVGPVPIEIPKLQIPTLLAMTEHTVDSASSPFPGAVLITLPKNSPIVGLTGLNEPIRAVVTLLETIRDTHKILNAALFQRYTGTIDELNRLLNTLLRAGNVRCIKADEVFDLGGVTMDPGSSIGWGYSSWNEETSALLLIGPPGRAARFHHSIRLWTKHGAFTVKVGPAGVAFVGVLRGSNPTAGPDGSGSSVEVTHPSKDFNDSISSYRFVLS